MGRACLAQIDHFHAQDSSRNQIILASPSVPHGESEKKTISGIKHYGLIARTKFDQFVFSLNGQPVFFMDHGETHAGQLNVPRALLHRDKLACSVACEGTSSGLCSHGTFCECMVHTCHLLGNQVPAWIVCDWVQTRLLCIAARGACHDTRNQNFTWQVLFETN